MSVHRNYTVAIVVPAMTRFALPLVVHSTVVTQVPEPVWAVQQAGSLQKDFLAALQPVAALEPVQAEVLELVAGQGLRMDHSWRLPARRIPETVIPPKAKPVVPREQETVRHRLLLLGQQPRHMDWTVVAKAPFDWRLLRKPQKDRRCWQQEQFVGRLASVRTAAGCTMAVATVHPKDPVPSRFAAVAVIELVLVLVVGYPRHRQMRVSVLVAVAFLGFAAEPLGRVAVAASLDIVVVVVVVAPTAAVAVAHHTLAAMETVAPRDSWMTRLRTSTCWRIHTLNQP